jgi:hypothetical protein
MRFLDAVLSCVVGNAGKRSVLRSVHEALVYSRKVMFECGNCSVEVDWL